jgi:enoyl-[acyl-carrier-protein] reductase (NADH)
MQPALEKVLGSMPQRSIATIEASLGRMRPTRRFDVSGRVIALGDALERRVVARLGPDVEGREERGVRVNALCAGVTATRAMRQAEELVPALVQQLVAEHPIGRMASEEEIASVALWLCSPGAAYVTGAAIAVDGGFSAG